MKNLILYSLLLLLPCLAMSQPRQEFVKEMNNAIENKSEAMKFFEKTGTLEHREIGGVYRIKLEDIQSIKEKVVESNFIINVYCRDANCFTVYRKDTIGSQLNNNAYFFTSAERAFQFAKNLSLLVNSYLPENQKVQLELLEPDTKNTDQTKASTIEAQPKTTKEKDQLDAYLEKQDEEEEDVKPQAREADQSTSEKAAAAKERMEQIKADREEKRAQLKADREEKKEQEKEIREEQIGEIKSKQKRSSPRKEEDAESLGGLAKEEETEDKPKDKKNDALCKPIDQIFSSAINSQFKSIEGAETNTVKHINESKVRWKGAKRSYIGNFKGKRTFIAELKTSKDFELLQIEYDELQTDLENCLGPDWEFTDHSNDEEYADFNGEIRDTEYHNSSNPQLPKLRIILISDQDKYTLFVRIQ